MRLSASVRSATLGDSPSPRAPDRAKEREYGPFFSLIPSFTPAFDAPSVVAMTTTKRRRRTPFPPLDLARLRYLCERLSVHRAGARSSVEVVMRLRGRTVTLEELRAGWDGLPIDEDEHNFIAQLRYDPATTQWTLYRAGPTRWQQVRGCPPTRFLEPLIREIETDPAAMTWPLRDE